MSNPNMDLLVELPRFSNEAELLAVSGLPVVVQLVIGATGVVANDIVDEPLASEANLNFVMHAVI